MKISPYESNRFIPGNRKEWREWLSKNHKTCSEIWLVYFKKGTNKPTISYNDSVEEAVCFGWIDGIKKRIDDESYCHRFTPRRTKSQWSETNIRRGKEMVEKGLMTSAGLELFSEALNKPGRINVSPQSLKLPLMPGDLSLGLKENSAYESFMNFSESYRSMCIRWVESAKKEDTRIRRIKEVIDKTKAGVKIGLK